MQEQTGQPPQVVLTLPLLEGTDGVNKMSKSLGNYIAVNDTPADMFGKVMGISDELMARWYPILLGEELDKSLHPMEAKKQLAARLVTRFHNGEAARQAREGFEKVFSQHQLPDEIPSFTLSENKLPLAKLLQEIKAASSGSEARRLITQGGVTVAGEKVVDPMAPIDCSTETVVKCGKRFFAKVKA